MAKQDPDSIVLKQIFEDQKMKLDISQRSLATDLGVTQGAISGYLNGYTPLNLRVAVFFAKALQVPIDAFSPRLAKEAVDLFDVMSEASGTVIGTQAPTDEQVERANMALIKVTAGVLSRALYIPEIEALEAIGRRLEGSYAKED